MKLRTLMVFGTAMALGLPIAAQAATTRLAATLTGANETKGGDTDGTGSFSAELDTETGDICYVLAVSKIATATAAHIHEGAAGADGGPVVAIEVTGDSGDLCMAAEPDLLKAIVAAPGNYYVNVHNADHPAGAIRGQLTK